MVNYQKTSRAIIFNEKKDSLISIKRTKYKNGKFIKEYYTFPGGHVEENETFEKTLIREIQEELSTKVNIIKEVAHVLNKEIGKEEKFFLCEKVEGNIHQGNGPEFTNIDYEKYGKFEIVELELKDLEKYNLLPIEIKELVQNF